MKIQFEGDILLGNHGAILFRNWTIKADEGESEKDLIIATKRMVIERLDLARAALKDDIDRIERGEAEALAKATMGMAKH